MERMRRRFLTLSERNRTTWLRTIFSLEIIILSLVAVFLLWWVFRG
jgi:hypothetical protein